MLNLSLPEQIIIQFDQAMLRFWELLDRESIPTLNPSDVFFQLIEVVKYLRDLDDRLANAALNMGVARWLFDADVLNEEQEQIVIHTVASLGHEIKNKLLALHAYRDGVFPYEFEEFFDDHTVVFRRSPDGGATAGSGTGVGFVSNASY